MAIFDAMVTPNTERLAHLKLDGFRWGSAVRFCPNCDFQYNFECAAAYGCPNCENDFLHVVTVTPDLVARVRAAA